jgi:hypothetical protein
MAEIKKQDAHEAPKPKYVKPYEPENIHLSRDEYVKQQREKEEKRAKIEAFGKDLDKNKEVAEPKPEVKKGRPKKID